MMQKLTSHCASLLVLYPLQHNPGDAVRACSVVAALLLWTLQQQLAQCQPLAAAFKAADKAGRSVLGLQEFRVFCGHLNGALSQEEVAVLWQEELDVQGHGQVTFSAVCRALLPAM